MEQKKKKIILVEPRGVKANVYAKYMNLPLMGPLILGTILKQAGYEVVVYNENILKRDVGSQELKADFLCLTILTSTARRGYQIARQFRALNSGSKIIIGGVHASFIPEEALQYADQVVCGEGEEVVLKILRGEVRDRIVRTELLKDLDRSPQPNFNVLKDNEKMSIYPMITSRGCPYDCDFCSVTQMFGRGYRMTSVDRVISDFKSIPGKNIFVYDDNFTVNIKRTEEILDRLIKENIEKSWSTQTRVDITRHENLIEKMSRAGCCTVYIGFESVNPKTLDNFNKRQSVEEIKQAIEMFHKYGIKIHGMFIFGSDEDDSDVFEYTSKFSKKYQIDTVQYSALTPLPGTRTFQQLKNEQRILHYKWDYYDGMHVVFKPKLMSPWELQKGIIDTYEDFYSYLMMVEDAFLAGVDFMAQSYHRTINGISFGKMKKMFIRLAGHKIVKQWQQLNEEYLDYLRNLR